MKFGIFVSGFLVAIFFLLGFGSVSKPAEAKVYLRGDCKKGLSTYKRKRGWKAFALSSSGYACGASWEHFSRKKAISRALSECYKRGKGCRIHSVYGKSRKTKKSGKRSRSGRLRIGKTCQRVFKKWKTKPGYKAFLVSTDGRACHSNWNHGSVNAAISAARDNCIDPNCYIYNIGAPRRIVEKWQSDLKTIELYKGKIDSKWGPDTRFAMRKFAKLAKLKNTISGGAFLQLHWAALIKTKFQVTSKKAIEHSGAAVNAKSLDDVRKLVKAESR